MTDKQTGKKSECPGQVCLTASLSSPREMAIDTRETAVKTKELGEPTSPMMKAFPSENSSQWEDQTYLPLGDMKMNELHNSKPAQWNVSSNITDSPQFLI